MQCSAERLVLQRGSDCDRKAQPPALQSYAAGAFILSWEGVERRRDIMTTIADPFSAALMANARHRGVPGLQDSDALKRRRGRHCFLVHGRVQEPDYSSHKWRRPLRQKYCRNWTAMRTTQYSRPDGCCSACAARTNKPTRYLGCAVSVGCGRGVLSANRYGGLSPP